MATTRTFGGAAGLNHSPGAVVNTGAFTWVAVVKPAVANAVQYVLTSSTVNGQSAIRLNASGVVTLALDNTGYATPTSVTYAPAEGWALIAITKAAGTSVFRIHKYVFSTGAWTRQSSTTTYASPAGSVAEIRHGHLGNNNYLNGDLAATAAYDFAMSDAQVTTLVDNLDAWVSLAPKGMWVFDQATVTSVPDETGNGADQTGTSGSATTISASAAPIEFSASPSGDPLAYRANSGASGTGTAGVATLTIPAAVQTGDMMIIAVSYKLLIGSATINTPTGWSVIQSPTNGPSGNTFQGAVYAKIATSGDPGSTLTVNTTSASQQINVAFAAYSGAQNNLRSVSWTVGSTTASTTVSAPGPTTPPISGDKIVVVGAVRGSTNGPAGQPTFTGGGDVTIRGQSANSSGSAQNTAAFIGDASASTAGTRTATASLASWAIAGQLVLVPNVVTQTVTPTGIASTSTVGAPTVSPGAVTVAPTGIASTGAVGQPAVSPGPVNVTPTGVSSASGVGAPTLTPGPVGVTLSGVASTAAVGAPTVGRGPVNVAPLGIPTAAAFGTPTLTPGPVAVSLTGVASTAAVGQPAVLASPPPIKPTGIPSTSAVGQPTVSPGPVTVAPQGVASTSAVGAPALAPGPVNVAVSGVPSTSAVGTPLVGTGSVVVVLFGVASTSAVGQPTLTPGPVTVAPTGVPSTSQVGQPAIGLTIRPTGVASTSQVGQPAVTPGAAGIVLTGVPSTSAVGQPDIAAGSVPDVLIYVDGIPSESAVGQPTLTVGPVDVAPLGVPPNNRFGSPTVRPQPVGITVQGVPSTSAVGTPEVAPGPVQVRPTGVPSTAQVGQPAVTVGATVIALGGVPSISTVGVPLVRPGAVTVRTIGIPSAAQVGKPTVERAGLQPPAEEMVVTTLDTTMTASGSSGDGMTVTTSAGGFAVTSRG